MDGRRSLGGRYRLEERLGDGGMSVVWRAYDTVLGRSVAVKILASSLAANPAFRRTIRTEAQAAARLSHPNVTAVFDYGEDVDDSGELLPYVVMELLGGQSLAARLGEDGPLEPPFALRVCAQVAGGLAAAHAHGLVHRDIKPGNVMLTRGGAKVFDFGLAAAVGQLDDSDPEGPILGTAAYLAPERLAGAAVTAASDVYALALLLFRALTNRLPWPVHTVTEMIAAHVYAEPGPLPEIEGVPPAVHELARRCLSKEPGLRPSAREAAVVFANAAGIRPPLGTEETDDLRAFLAPVVVRRRKTVRVFGVAAVALVALVSTVVVSSMRDGDPAGSGVTSPSGTGSASATGSSPASTGSPFTSGGATGTAVPTGPGAPGGSPPGPGSTGPTGNGDGTSVPPTSPPTATTPAAGDRTFTSDGGSVVARCGAAGAYLVSWAPEPGYKAQQVNQGPASVASLVFHMSSTKITVRVTCPNGEPAADFETKLA